LKQSESQIFNDKVIEIRERLIHFMDLLIRQESLFRK